MKYSVYRLSDGAFTGGCFPFGKPVYVPEGCGLISGDFDPLCQRVDITATPPETPSLDVNGMRVPWEPPVVDYIPTAPADDDLQTWAWNTGTKRWGGTPTLLAVQNAKWEELKDQRSALEFGGFTWDGDGFDSDSLSQSRIQGAVVLAMQAAAAEVAFSIDWTLADNTVRTMDAQDMVGCGQALAAHVATQHETARALRVAVFAATTKAQVEEVVWP